MGSFGAFFALLAVGMLAVVTFSVPYIKPFHFLKASFSEDGWNGSVTLGTLGFCLDFSNVTTCLKPSSIVYKLGQFLVPLDNKSHFP